LILLVWASVNTIHRTIPSHSLGRGGSQARISYLNPSVLMQL
jgi:hypothetical protein